MEKPFLLLIILCMAAGCREPKLEDYAGTYENYLNDEFKYLIIKDSTYYFADYEGWCVDPVFIEKYEDADSLAGDSITIALAKGLQKTEDRFEWLREKYTEHKNHVKFSLSVPEYYPDLILCVENYNTGEKTFGETMDSLRYLSVFLPCDKVHGQTFVFYTYHKVTKKPFKGCLLITNNLTLRSLFHTQHLIPIPFGSSWNGNVILLAFKEDKYQTPIPPLKKPYKPLHEATSVEDLYQYLKANEAVFWDKYDTVSVRGIVKSVPSKHCIILSSEDEDETYTIKCYTIEHFWYWEDFPKTDIENIRRGDVLYVRGVPKENGGGLFEWVSSTEKIKLTDCTILN